MSHTFCFREERDREFWGFRFIWQAWIRMAEEGRDKGTFREDNKETVRID